MAAGNMVAIQEFKFGTGKTWAETAANTTAAQTVTVKELRTTDFVLVRKPTEQAGLDYNPVARVSADNTLTIIFSNPTAAGVTATAEEEWTGILFRSENVVPTNVSI